MKTTEQSTSKRPVDILAKAKHSGLVWRTVALLSLTLNGVGFLAGAYAVANLPDHSKAQFIIPPPPGVLDVVRPGELHQSYVEMGFRYVASLVNGWNYDSIEDNYKILFENFYSKELTEKTRASLRAEDYIEVAKERHSNSIWRYIPEESEFRWCGNVKILKHSQGVACGIVTGEQSLYTEHNNPVLRRKISYLMFALNVAPNPLTPGKNMFALKVFRIKRGELRTLKVELEQAHKHGVLPPMEESRYADR